MFITRTARHAAIQGPQQLLRHLSSATGKLPDVATKEPEVLTDGADKPVDTLSPTLEDAVRRAQAAEASGAAALSKFAGSLETWLGNQSEQACAAMTAMTRASTLERIDTGKPEMLRRLLCTPLNAPQMTRLVAGMADRIASSAAAALPHDPAAPLAGKALESAAQCMLSAIQTAMGIPAEFMIDRISWEPLGTQTMAKYIQFPSEQNGVPASERLAINSDRLLGGMPPQLLANGLAHELTHKYQYLQRDALTLLDRTKLNVADLQAMTPAARLHAVRNAWPAGESRALQNLALNLLSNPQVLATARLTTACIDHQQTLTSVAEARRGSVMEQMAYAMGAAVEQKFRAAAECHADRQSGK